jgi:hypothetical protein
VPAGDQRFLVPYGPSTDQRFPSLRLASIAGMDERAPAEEQLAALHAALLTFYDDHTSVIARHRPEPTRRERLMSQTLQRLRLQWLAVLVALVVRAVRSRRQGRPVFGDVQPVARAYRALAGKDPDVARAEVWRMVHQLMPLDSRIPSSGGLPRQVTRAEFELAADALLRFYVAGRSTDDPLLEATQEAFGEVEAVSEAMLDRAHGQDRSTSAQRREDRERYEAATRRYAEAWLRWLDHHAAQSGQ